MNTFLQIIQVSSAVIMIFLILLHHAKSDGIAAMGGSSQMFKSTSGLDKGLSVVTWGFSIIFFVISAALGWRLL